MKNDMSDNKTGIDEKSGATFETAIMRLEEIVRALESGNTTLDASLTLFREGVELVRLCNEKLYGAEQQIKMLTFTPDGAAAEIDFAAEK